MIFWILAGLTIAAIIFFAGREFLDGEIGYGFAYGLVALVVGGFASAILMLVLVALFFQTHLVSDTHKTYNLTSIQTAQQGEIHGNRWYLSGNSGTGYTYMYQATDESGENFYKLGNADADSSRVYQDATTPRVQIERKHYEGSNGWIAPFSIDIETDTSYTFHVPEGSIVQEYKAN